MKRIADGFTRLEAAVVATRGRPFSPGEREGAVLTYYAGAALVFEAVAAIGNDDVSEDEGIARMEAMRHELDAFTAEAAAGASKRRES